MLLIYQPANGERREFEFDFLKLRATEAEAIEDYGNGVWSDYPEWIGKVTSGNVRATRVLLWTLLRRTDPDLDLGAVDFQMDEFAVFTEETPPVGKGETGETDTGSP